MRVLRSGSYSQLTAVWPVGAPVGCRRVQREAAMPRPKGAGGAAAAAEEDAPSTQQVRASVERAEALAERVDELRGRHTPAAVVCRPRFAVRIWRQTRRVAPPFHKHVCPVAPPVAQACDVPAVPRANGGGPPRAPTVAGGLNRKVTGREAQSTLSSVYRELEAQSTLNSKLSLP